MSFCGDYDGHGSLFPNGVVSPFFIAVKTEDDATTAMATQIQFRMGEEEEEEEEAASALARCGFWTRRNPCLVVRSDIHSDFLTGH